jgi:carbon storage regulator
VRYLSRKLGAAVVIKEIEVRVVAIAGGTVKLGFPFPGDASVLGEEAVEAIQLANRAATGSAGAPLAGGRMVARPETQGSGPSDR